MPPEREALVIGGGQAGLAVSYHLTVADCDHVVLERDRVGERWRSERWDSFTLVTPNWMNRLPGFPYRGDDPDGFLTREQVVTYLEDYVAHFDPPLRCGIEATAVRRDGSGFTVETTAGPYEAANVVVATGTFQRPRVPEFNAAVPSTVRQLHSSRYQSPDHLPPGAVLVVGSGQSGAQIAQELHEAGRDVYLSVSGGPKVPRRYRGRDFTRWLLEIGLDETVEDLDSPAERFAPHPYVSGKDGGREIDLLDMAEEGMTLLGRTVSAADGRLHFADDLEDNLRAAFEAYRELTGGIDQYVEEAGVDAPPPTGSPPDVDDIAVDAIGVLDLESANVRTVVWATGYGFDFGWVEPATLDEWGYPVQDRGVTDVPGLYSVGLHWLHTQGSGLLVGVGEDAEHVADHLLARTSS
jgi:putative flavoprotein involved in K+ transport